MLASYLGENLLSFNFIASPHNVGKLLLMQLHVIDMETERRMKNQTSTNVTSLIIEQQPY